MNRFEGCTVLITAATGALGASMCRAFYAEWANVVAARRTKDAEALIEERGNRAIFVHLDVINEANWNDVVARTHFGTLSVLINNAAYLLVGGVEDIHPDQWRKVIDTNLTGAYLGIRAVAPTMRSAGGGSIVNISSIAGLHAAPHLVAYSASKWGIRGLTRTATYELARSNIRVNDVHPGVINTPLAYDPATGAELVPVASFAIPRQVEPDEVNKCILFVASDDATFATASEFVIDGGFSLGPITM